MDQGLPFLQCNMRRITKLATFCFLSSRPLVFSPQFYSVWIPFITAYWTEEQALHLLWHLKASPVRIYRQLSHLRTNWFMCNFMSDELSYHWNFKVAQTILMWRIRLSWQQKSHLKASYNLHLTNYKKNNEHSDPLAIYFVKAISRLR